MISEDELKELKIDFANVYEMLKKGYGSYDDRQMAAATLVQAMYAKQNAKKIADAIEESKPYIPVG